MAWDFFSWKMALINNATKLLWKQNIYYDVAFYVQFVSSVKSNNKQSLNQLHQNFNAISKSSLYR